MRTKRVVQRFGLLMITLIGACLGLALGAAVVAGVMHLSTML